MSLTFNGVLIPEDVANALTFNGFDITDVFFDGVQVWNQVLYSGIWSGNSYSVYGGLTQGIEVSGNLARMYTSSIGSGNWISVDINGVFSNNSSLTNNVGFVVQADLRSWKFTYNGTPAPTAVSFDTVTRWVGSSIGGYYATQGLTTSGGLIRYSQIDTAPGPWISLD